MQTPEFQNSAFQDGSPISIRKRRVPYCWLLAKKKAKLTPPRRGHKEKFICAYCFRAVGRGLHVHKQSTEQRVIDWCHSSFCSYSTCRVIAISCSTSHSLTTKITSSLEFNISEFLQCVPVTSPQLNASPWTVDPLIEPECYESLLALSPLLKEAIPEKETISRYDGPLTPRERIPSNVYTTLNSSFHMFSPGE